MTFPLTAPDPAPWTAFCCCRPFSHFVLHYAQPMLWLLSSNDGPRLALHDGLLATGSALTLVGADVEDNLAKPPVCHPRLCVMVCRACVET